MFDGSSSVRSKKSPQGRQRWKMIFCSNAFAFKKKDENGCFAVLAFLGECLMGSIQFCSLNIFAMADSFWNFKFLTVTLFLLDGFVVKPFAKTSEESQVMWWSKTVFDDVSNQNQNRCLIVVNCFCLNNFYERFILLEAHLRSYVSLLRAIFFAHGTFEGPTVFFWYAVCVQTTLRQKRCKTCKPTKSNIRSKNIVTICCPLIATTTCHDECQGR